MATPPCDEVLSPREFKRPNAAKGPHCRMRLTDFIEGNKKTDPGVGTAPDGHARETFEAGVRVRTVLAFPTRFLFRGRFGDSLA